MKSKALKRVLMSNSGIYVDKGTRGMPQMVKVRAAPNASKSIQ